VKIVHLSNTPLSNSPANLAQIQREAGHDSIVMLHRQSNTNKVFVGGEVWTALHEVLLRGILECADVIHLHNFAWTQEIFKQHPEFIDIVKKKPCLIQYHSPRNSTENFEFTLRDPWFKGKRAVVAQYQVRQYPEAEHVVPNVLPIFDLRFRPLAARPQTPVTVSFAPSNTNLKGWDYKGFDVIQPIFRDLARWGVNAEIITNTPYEETMIKKKWSNIGLEEIVTGSYHLSFLEYMSMGCATFCYMDTQTRAAMAKVIGNDAVEEGPWIDTDVERLREHLTGFIREPTETAEHGWLSRQWMEKHWHPTKLVKYFDDIYSRI
jgi:hypothetical protein